MTNVRHKSNSALSVYTSASRQRQSFPLSLSLHRRCTRCEFCKILLSYANVDKIMQNFAWICRRGNGFQRVHWRRRWQDGRGSRSFLPEHSETYQSISKHFVTSHCHLLRFVADRLGG